jgi:hypothetical protein
MLLRAHDNCGATSMGQDLSADRAQQHSGEPAMTSITHNQKLRTVRSIDENLSGVSLHPRTRSNEWPPPRCCAVTSRFGLFLPTAPGGDQPLPPPSDPTARAMTSKEVRSAAVACSPMNTLARLVRGIVSVGLKALELVSDT